MYAVHREIVKLPEGFEYFVINPSGKDKVAFTDEVHAAKIICADIYTNKGCYSFDFVNNIVHKGTMNDKDRLVVENTKLISQVREATLKQSWNVGNELVTNAILTKMRSYRV